MIPFCLFRCGLSGDDQNMVTGLSACTTPAPPLVVWYRSDDAPIGNYTNSLANSAFLARYCIPEIYSWARGRFFSGAEAEAESFV